ncbi:MAG: hypothetical protein IPJ90_16695 [Anaerolineaceae bacterium]|nr:hypothetical protein [Anaerolineaceae bacterium]
MNQTILFLIADSPGYFVQIIYQMAEALYSQGCKVIFASTSPYYERYKGFDLSRLGECHYFSDFLQVSLDSTVLEAVELNYWWTYPTFVRDHYFIGQHRNEWDVYKKLVLFHREVLQKHNPDLVVSEPPSNAFLYIAFHMAQQNHVPYLGFISARIPGNINVFLDEYGEKMLPNIADNPSQPVPLGQPDYMLDQTINWREKGMLSKIWRMMTIPVPRSIESGNTALHQLRSYQKRLERNWRYARALQANVFANNVNLHGKINVLHPLHFRPEASTSVLARYYENDLELLKNIAFSLPNNAQLIVKEHKSAIGIRDVTFYQRLLSYPNTVLLHPDYNLPANLPDFDAVVILTSTVSFEAMQESIPVFVLGNVFFATYPEATRIFSYHELEEKLRELKKHRHQPNPEVMDRYQKYCFLGQFNYLNSVVVTPRNIENLLVPVRQVLNQMHKENEPC